MFKFISVFALVAASSAAPGFFTESHHTVVQPAVLAKTAVVDNSASSAITHQSFTNLEKKLPIVHTYAAAAAAATPVVPTYESVAATPFVHTYESAAPVVKTVAATPFIHTYEAAPAAASLVHSYETAPVVHSLPVVHSAPVVNTVLSSPVAYHSFH